MSQELVAFWLGIVMLASLPTILVGTYITIKYPTIEYISDKFLTKMFRLGLALGMVGLSVQTYRSLYFFDHGSYPVDVYFPTWATKDIGFCLIIASLALQKLIAKRGE